MAGKSPPEVFQIHKYRLLDAVDWLELQEDVPLLVSNASTACDYLLLCPSFGGGSQLQTLRLVMEFLMWLVEMSLIVMPTLAP